MMAQIGQMMEDSIFISFTKRNHDRRYGRGWNGIYHYIKSITFKAKSSAFITECGLKIHSDDLFSVTLYQKEPKEGWLCKNCDTVIINLANKPYEEQYAN